jgi:hypothetical protein
MAILTAKYTEAQKNDGSLNTTPHELNAAMGLIGGNPNGRIQSVTDYVKKSPDFVATVTSSQIKASFNPTQNADFYFGIFNQNYSGSDAVYLFNNVTGTITGWTAGVNGSLNDRYSVTGINIDAKTYFNSATWANVLVGNDTLVGGPGNDRLQDYGSNNKFQGMGGNDTFIAAAGGINTGFFRGKSADYSIKSSSRIEYDGLIGLKGYTVNDSVSNRDGFTQLINVNRLSFTDKNIALDIGKDQSAGQAYMLYKAAFNRPSDEAGLGFWITGLDNGAKLVDVAKGFIDTPEFVKLYGDNVSNTTFVSNLYKVVLNRNLDKEGSDFWVKALDNGALRANLLVDFAVSNENVTQVASLIANGIPYTV